MTTVAFSINNLFKFGSNSGVPYLGSEAIRRGLRSLAFIVASMAFASTTAIAQKPAPEPSLVPGAEVNLASVMAADWVQGEGPGSFEPGKVYMFECWATWCGPCVALIPHVNELHKEFYDKGLRVYGMNCWEDGRDKVTTFVGKKGEGMSYPVAYTGEGSKFETQWLDASGVEAIPYAFVVKDGKLLLSTEASRLTNALVETMLSSDEGAKKAAAVIQNAYDVRDTSTKLMKEIHSADRAKDSAKMAAAIKELETIDAGNPELSMLKLRLLIVRKEWDAAVETINNSPASYTKNSFLLMTGLAMARDKARGYPVEFTKAVTIPYSKYVAKSGKAIGPNHFAALSVLFDQIGDEQASIMHAEKGLVVAKEFAGASEFRTKSFERFVKSVKEGTVPGTRELSKWHIEFREKAAAAK